MHERSILSQNWSHIQSWSDPRYLGGCWASHLCRLTYQGTYQTFNAIASVRFCLFIRVSSKFCAGSDWLLSGVLSAHIQVRYLYLCIYGSRAQDWLWVTSSQLHLSDFHRLWAVHDLVRPTHPTSFHSCSIQARDSSIRSKTSKPIYIDLQLIIMSCLSDEKSHSSPSWTSHRKEAVSINRSRLAWHSRSQRLSIVYILICLLAAIAIPGAEPTTEVAGKSIEKAESLLVDGDHGGPYIPTTRFYDFNVSSMNSLSLCEFYPL